MIASAQHSCAREGFPACVSVEVEASSLWQQGVSVCMCVRACASVCVCVLDCVCERVLISKCQVGLNKSDIQMHVSK